MYAVCIIGSVCWKLLWVCETEGQIEIMAKRKMQADNKLFLQDKFMKYLFLLLGISWGKDITGGETGVDS